MNIVTAAMKQLVITSGFIVIALLLPLIAAAQDIELDPESSGNRYIIAFPDTVGNTLDARYPNTRGPRSEFTIWIYSAVNNKVRISHKDRGATTLDVAAGKFKLHNVTGASVIDVVNTPVANTYMVEAEQPIIIYCHLATIQGLETWTPIPVDRWGTSYTAAALPGDVVKDIHANEEVNVPHRLKEAPAMILVIAAHDDTRVTFSPTEGSGFVGAPPNDVTLRAGEAYLVQSRVAVESSTQEEIAGTTITATKPIGVLSGNTRSGAGYNNDGVKGNIYKNMMVEWLAPKEQHGRKFVFLPTWDGMRPGSGSPAERKREYVRLYGTRGESTSGHHLQPNGETPIPFIIQADSLLEFAFGAPAPVYFETATPAQAFMHSSSIVKFNGSTPCYGGIPCLSYDGWAPYMVEMVPREQWTSFAPYYAPVNPGGMLHYLNVVADTISAQNIYRETGSKFSFTRKIRGTDLIWGSVPVNPGQDNYLIGRNGARFYAFAYGIFKGFEEYRPGRMKKDDEHAIASAGAHPAEYEEYNALAYGYPLAPRRTALGPADSIRIDTMLDCGELTIEAEMVNPDPQGFRSVELDPKSTVNARLVAVDPESLSDISGRTAIEVKVEPNDPLRNAQTTVILTDRTGKSREIAYRYSPERVDIAQSPIVDFGPVNPSITVDTTVTISNPMERPIDVNNIELALGNQGFTIIAVSPVLPVRLASGEQLTVTLRSNPSVINEVYNDSLKISLGCTTISLPLTASSAVSGIRESECGNSMNGDLTVVTPRLNGNRVLLRYTLPISGDARLDIYNALGRRAATLLDGASEAGTHTILWDAGGFASGVYYCRIAMGEWSRTVQVMVQR